MTITTVQAPRRTRGGIAYENRDRDHEWNNRIQRARDEIVCSCGHKNVSHAYGARTVMPWPDGSRIGRGVCGMSPCPCRAFTDPTVNPIMAAFYAHTDADQDAAAWLAEQIPADRCGHAVDEWHDCDCPDAQAEDEWNATRHSLLIPATTRAQEDDAFTALTRIAGRAPQ